MLRNNLKIAFRQLSKNRTYALINIMGLAIGIAASLLIYRILRYELSFNQNFEKSTRIVRVLTHTSGGENGEQKTRGLPIPGMVAIAGAVPQFEHSTRLHEDWPTITIPQAGGGPPLKKISIDQAEVSFFAEPGFLKIFDFQWLAGNPETALNEVGDIVLTRRVAEFCFETAGNALEKTVVLDNNVPCIVRGVIEDLPANCDFPIFSIASYATLRANAGLYFFRENSWGSISSNDQFFALLHDKNQFSAAEAALAQVGQEELNERKRVRNIHNTFVMQSMADMHFDEEVGNSGHTISRSRLWVLGTIGFLVLLMACFNFINLATALSTLRAREVGVRKAIGGNRRSLVAQFMTETSLIVAFSLAVGIGLAFLCAPLLKHISDVPDSQPFLNDPVIWLFLAIVGVLVTLLSGFYPSMVLSGLSPLKALRNNLSSEKGGGVSLRKGLVVAQFAIAQALIIGAIVTVSQLDYIRELDLGFNKDLVLVTRFNADSVALTRLATMKQRLQQIPAVEYVSFSSDQPASGNTWSSNFNVDRKNEEPSFHTSVKLCDADYQKTYGLEMLAGRWFEASDTVKEYVVNETMCRKLGISPEAAVGKAFRVGGGNLWLPIAGVVKDFHSHSLHEEFEALTMLPKQKFYSGVGIKIRPGNIPGTTEAIRKVYDETFPEQVFVSEFYDESIANFYQAESRFSDFCKGIAALAILIGCLGLFGLATHAAARRTKEIGVRKVLGASVANITSLLTRDFLKLVLVAIFIATPVAYYFMQQWLSDFVFRINMAWWMFAVACSGAVLVAFFTVSFQSVKAALANPVKSLRSE